MESFGTITLFYRAVDGYSATKKFASLGNARKFAQHCLGQTPEFGRTYAVSDDGVGRLSCKGCTLADLFPRCAS